MVNIFGDKDGGGERGPMGPSGRRGDRGPPGDSGALCEWMPNSVLKQLQHEDELCFLLTSASDVRREGEEVVEWKCRNTVHESIVAESPSKELIEIPGGGHALRFRRSVYFQNEMRLFDCTLGESGYLCITFKVIGDGDQTLLTNYKSPDLFRQFNEIAVSKSEIQILGYRDRQARIISIVHDCSIWTTLFVDFQVLEGGTSVNWSVDGNSGNFTFDGPIMCERGLFIGGRHGGDRFFDGAIASIESNCRTAQKIPDALKELIINGQKVKGHHVLFV